MEARVPVLQTQNHFCYHTYNIRVHNLSEPEGFVGIPTQSGWRYHQTAAEVSENYKMAAAGGGASHKMSDSEGDT